MHEEQEYAVGPFSDSESESSGSDSDDDVEDAGEGMAQSAAAWNRPFTPTVDDFINPVSSFKEDFGVRQGSSGLEILKQFIKDDMVDEMCYQSNLYAAQVRLKNPKAFPCWKEVQRNEMWQFLGLNMAMGINRKPSIKDYWGTSKITSSPFFREVMSRSRFEDILRSLHFVNNETVPKEETDRFVKLGNFLKDMLRNFNSAVTPSEYLCLDETLVGFKGRVSFRQYNPKKRARFGIKLFVLVDCKSRMVLDILPYQGKSTAIERDEVRELGFGGAAVTTMLQPHLGKSHKVVIDNYFNSPILARKLVDSKTYLLGTAQKRRKEMPKMPTVKVAKLTKGDCQTFSDGKILVERWIDRREVIMLNTFLTHEMQPSRTRNPQTVMLKPATVLRYNDTMGAVDEMDKGIKCYSHERRTYKWYKKVFFYLLNVGIYNAFKVHCHFSGHKSPYKDYLLNLIEEILSVHPVVRSVRGRPPTTPRKVTETAIHMPMRMVGANGKASKSDCVLCKRNGKRKQTQFKCKTCNKRLCIQSGVSCFEKYHTVQVQPTEDSSMDISISREDSAVRNESTVTTDSDWFVSVPLTTADDNENGDYASADFRHSQPMFSTQEFRQNCERELGSRESSNLNSDSASLLDSLIVNCDYC